MFLIVYNHLETLNKITPQNYFLLDFLKIKDLNNTKFITINNTNNKSKAYKGCLGANAAINIIGKPKTMAGKFW